MQPQDTRRPIRWRGRGARNGKVYVKRYDSEGNLITSEVLDKAPKPELLPGANPFVSHDLSHDYTNDRMDPNAL